MRFVPVGSLAPEQLARARAIYEDSFPPQLRADFDSLLSDIALAYVDEAAEGSGELVCGLVVLRAMPSTGWLFLRYFVAGVRGRGIGSLMWRAMCAEFPEVERIALDVEDPDEPGIDAHELEERLRRITFYERLGVELLPVRGYRPPHDGEEPALRPLVHPAVPDRSLGDVRDLVLAIYRDRYGLDADDPAVVRTLEQSGLT